MRRIAFINEKGGTCKTTLCVNVARAARRARAARPPRRPRHPGARRRSRSGVDVRRLSAHRPRAGCSGPRRSTAVVRPTAIAGPRPPPREQGPRRLPGRRWRPAATARTAPCAVGSTRSRRGRYDLVLVDSPPSRVARHRQRPARRRARSCMPVALTYLALDGCAEILESLERLRAERGAAPALDARRPDALPEDPARRRDPGEAARARSSATRSRGRCSAGRSRWTRRRATAAPSSSTRRARPARAALAAIADELARRPSDGAGAAHCRGGCLPVAQAGGAVQLAPAGHLCSTVVELLLEPVDPARELVELALHLGEVRHPLHRRADALVHLALERGDRPPARPGTSSFARSLGLLPGL